MTTLSLNGNWTLCDTQSTITCPATVPGCNYQDLIAADVIPEPYKDTNEKDCFFVYSKDWVYTRTFNVTAELLQNEVVELVCEMLDTLSEVYINNTLIANTNNMHRTYYLDIKPHIHSGENEIKIIFRSPEKYIEERKKLYSLPPNSMGLRGCPHIRKSPCHFGWDFAPTLPPAGISRDIYIKAYNQAKIDDITVFQKHSKSIVTLTVKCLISTPSNGVAAISVISPDNTVISQRVSFNSDSLECEFDIDNPQLWWSNGLGEQPLYTVEVKLSNDSGMSDEKSVTIGLRTLELHTEKDEYGNNFCFYLNGIPVFAKGANFIPPDIFRTRITHEKLYYILKSAKDANMNLIRVWGGGYYESDDFYSICDELGILVWQDMNFACSAYPFRLDDFRENVLLEIKDNINRLKNHACLALYSGNNEIESMSMAWQYHREVIKDTGTFFYETLRDEIRKYDTVTPYWACSPSSGEYMKNINSDSFGDTHLWHVWHGLRNFQYYRKRYTRFCSEFGLESYPTMSTLRQYIDKNQLFFGSDSIQAHQKCDGGDIKMLYYLNDRWWEPQSFEHLVYLTQLSQAECISDATEHWRRNMKRCHGSLYWQLNDCWCGTSWASLDYLGGYKALHYIARRFNAPMSVSIENNKTKISVFAINDTACTASATVKYRIEALDGKILASESKNVLLEPVKSLLAVSVNCQKAVFGNKKKSVFVAELYNSDGELISQKRCLFSKENQINFADPQIKTDIKKTSDGFNLTLTAQSYARYVLIEYKNAPLVFSDNFFDMSANETRTVTVSTTIPEKEFVDGINVYSLYDVKPAHSRIYDKLNRARIFMMPLNLANWFSRFFDK